MISEQDRNTIKSHLVQLMCTVPGEIKAQIVEAIALIAEVDYPQNWDNLLPELVQQFGSSDPTVVNGVLAVANSVFNKFRYVGRSDELYNIIKYSLERIQAPLLTLFVETGKAVDAYANDAAQLVPRLESLRLMCRIFYSLNYQDLPAFFEDHIQEWMEQFSKYLQYSNPVVTDDSEENEPSPIDKLQTAIVRNLALYADKDEECFLPFLGEFTRLVWGLLMRVNHYPKYDQLATTSIKFLSSLVAKMMHKNLFQDENTLREIVLKIVIPNLMFREVSKFQGWFRSFFLSYSKDFWLCITLCVCRATKKHSKRIQETTFSLRWKVAIANHAADAATISFVQCADNSNPKPRLSVLSMSESC